MVISLYCWAREGEREGEFGEGKMRNMIPHPLHKLTPFIPSLFRKRGEILDPQNDWNRMYE